MKTRDFSPTNLDVAAFAQDGAALQGEWAAASLPRLADAAAPDAPARDWPAVQGSLSGERREPRGAEAQTWLHLRAQATVRLTCQRCLQAVQEQVDVSRSFHFVRDEELAASLDVDSEDDVLAMTRHLDGRELVEDELLLSLPLVPRHDICPQPLPVKAEAEPEIEERPNPFAALAALKAKGGPTQ
ncbi:MAG: DUF177 domain-containing protein [Burkholderiaceae bacterium]